MAAMNRDFDDIWQRHARVVLTYSYLTQAEVDRGTLLAEVDRLRAQNQHLEMLARDF